jgi:hypothetical protein
VEGAYATRAAAGFRLGLEHDVVEVDLIGMHLLNAVGDPLIVLIALLPVFGLGDFAVEGFGEIGRAHV